MKKNNILFVNFSLDERTIELSKYSAIQNGFLNYVELNENITFYQKMIKFIDVCLETNYELFLRSDADRIILPGIDELLSFYSSQPIKPMFLQGTGIEYIMSLKRRNATPNFYSRECLEFLKNNITHTIKDDKKPESFIANYIKNNIGNQYFKSIKTKLPTNLHEFDQHPEKIVNAFLNRLWRGHESYYSKNYISSLPTHYKNAINIARHIYKKRKENKFIYATTEEILKINPSFATKLSPITDIEKTYNDYIKQFNK